ncbi:ADP-ribosylglycohydrolase family protein [Candidatus Uabimicrobium sp. HlEnr_7]|uniref:ADP-ribosylglycohydrolase family protein n=1 Tax=Candidatus Uabimicrobium helgolandensis TaxID=3095367 RepID=UPI003555E24C
MLSLNKNSIVGCLLGTAVGDALGLPWEGLSANRQRAFISNIKKHHFFCGKGMCSDDTEHTVLVTQALITAQDDVDIFRRDLARRLRWWLLGLPAGIGFATLRGILKLWIGFSPKTSGVFSAGNGPAMRSAILGLVYGEDLRKLHQFVAACTQMTHQDPKAELGALAVAVAAHLSATNQARPQKFFETISFITKEQYSEEDYGPFLELLQITLRFLEDKSLQELLDHLNLQQGISGYIYHTLPIVIFIWLKYPNNYRKAVVEIIRCGGDTDTGAAIVGGIIGCAVGKEGIPEEWYSSIIEWPRTTKWLETLAQNLCDYTPTKANVLLLLIRNIFFLFIALVHGFRRIFPPYK